MYRLANNPILEDYERDMVNEADALMPMLRRVFEKELAQVENKLDSETLFELPAYNERLQDLIAQRRVLKRIVKMFQEVDHAE